MIERRIGPHLQVHDGLVRAADRAHEIGATAVQVFTDNPTAWKRRTAPPDDLPLFRERLAGYGIGPLAVHASYLINLCGADEVFWQRSVATLASELQMSAAFGASMVNVHIGSHRGLGREQGLRRLARGLRSALDTVDEAPVADGQALPLIVLENSAGSGDGVGASIEDLADIARAVADVGADGRVAFCLDTAHLWAAGRRIDTEAGVAEVVTRVDGQLGRERVVMLHLNDARMACGSRLDRHEHIGAGMIGARGLGAVLADPWLGGLPTYLETPAMDTGYDAVNLERVRLLLRGESLPELPADAFAARAGRSRRAARVA